MDSRKTGKLIAKLRKSKDLTQAQLAEKLNVSSKTVSRWETGSAVDYSYLKDLSEILGITEIELIHGKIDDQKILLQREKIPFNLLLKKYCSQIILITIILILLISIIITRVYGFNNCETYSIRSENQDYLIKGLIVNTPIKDTIIINSIENVTNFDLDIVKVYTYQYSLYSNNTSIYSIGDIGLYEHDKNATATPINEILKNINLYMEEEHNFDDKIKKEYLNNLNIEIIYLDENLEKQVLKLPLKLIRTFTNNKIFYNGGEQF